MPCRCDYPEPNQRQNEIKRVCQLLYYALPAEGKNIPRWVVEAKDFDYGDVTRLDEATEMLCTLCRSMNRSAKNRIIYDGRTAEARKLAEWFDEHEKADAAREARERKAKLKRVAPDPLTVAQYKVVRYEDALRRIAAQRGNRYESTVNYVCNIADSILKPVYPCRECGTMGFDSEGSICPICGGE